MGAIYTNGVATAFPLAGRPGEDAGMIRSTGIYLARDGVARIIQQADVQSFDAEG
ncbi:MAG: hypothetical protein V1809_16750 [Planctomycetota bacterium]